MTNTILQACIDIATGFGFTIDVLPGNKIRCEVPYSFTYPSSFENMIWGMQDYGEDEFVAHILVLSEHVANRYRKMTTRAEIIS